MPNLSVPRMKNRATSFFNQVFSVVMAMVKSKSMAVKSKTSAMKSRLLIFGLLRNKKVLMSAISHKIHALMGQEKAEEDHSMAIVPCNMAEEKDGEAQPESSSPLATEVVGRDEDEVEDDDYPDLRHSLFELEEEEEDDDGLGDGTGSVIDLVKNSREEGAGDFSLEDEIDHVADMFIRRFHKQMKMQKLASFKRFQEMMERSA